MRCWSWMWVAGLSVLAGACANDGGGSAGQLVVNLQRCRLVGTGTLHPRPVTSAFDDCMVACRAGATCDELTQYYCDDRTSARLRDCERGCTGKRNCANGSGSYELAQVCDGRADCADGTDERGCGAMHYCTASGARLFAYQVCNGISDCSDNSDELGCVEPRSQFACRTRGAGFAQYISVNRVCDLVRDCADGSDESAEQGCARLTCP